MTSLFRDAMALSNGTMSYLISCTRYDVVDAVQKSFVDFCLENEGRFDTWVKAWEAFGQAFDISGTVKRLLELGQQKYFLIRWRDESWHSAIRLASDLEAAIADAEVSANYLGFTRGKIDACFELDQNLKPICEVTTWKQAHA